jgi:hypothetical protein
VAIHKNSEVLADLLSSYSSDSSANPQDLYMNEEDRKTLTNMTELEREGILYERYKNLVDDRSRAQLGLAPVAVDAAADNWSPPLTGQGWLTPCYNSVVLNTDYAATGGYECELPEGSVLCTVVFDCTGDRDALCLPWSAMGSKSLHERFCRGDFYLLKVDKTAVLVHKGFHRGTCDIDLAAYETAAGLQGSSPKFTLFCGNGFVPLSLDTPTPTRLADLWTPPPLSGFSAKYPPKSAKSASIHPRRSP